jgi:hypothetical protein
LPPAAAPPPWPTKLALRGYLRKAREEYEDFVIQGNDQVKNLFGDSYDLNISLAPEAASSRYSKAMMEQVLVRIEAVAATHRVPMLLLFIPHSADVSGGPRETAWRQAARAISSDYRPEALTDVLSDIAARHGFEYVDLFRPFLDAGADRLYIRSDGHWNAAGQDLAADLAMRKIVADGLLRRPDASR